MSEELNENEIAQENNEEVNNEVAPNQPNIPTATEAVDQGGGQIEHIMRLAESDPAIKELPEYKNMMEFVDNEVRQGGKAEQESEEETQEEAQEEEEEQVVNEEESKEEEEEEEDSNPFGIKTSKGKKKSKVPSFETSDEALEYMKKKYSVKDPSKFFESVDKWRNQSQKASDYESNYDELVEGLGSLPQPIKDAIDAYANAQDYREAFKQSTPSIDFSKDVDDLDKEAVVSHYFKAKVEKQKKKVDDGELYPEEYDEYIEDMYDSAERLFKSDKKDWERERVDYIRQEEESNEALKNSAINSVDSLKNKYPNFSSNELRKIRTSLVDGGLENLFYDKNGVFKEDAAEKVALALYGDKLIQSFIKQAESKSESKANANIVARGKKKMVGSKYKSGANKTDANNAIHHLSGQFNKDPYS